VLSRRSTVALADLPTASPVGSRALLDEVVARLGGPAWLDRPRVDEVVGELYPLYREPGRHAAPLAAAASR